MVAASGTVAGLLAAVIVIFLVVLFLFAAIKVVREYERGVIFRLGRLLGAPKGPGLFFLIPIVDRMVRIDLRTITLNVPPQEVITKDNVPARVNAVAYFRIVDPSKAVVQVENYLSATSQIAQTTLRSVLGQHVLDELLSEREKINTILQGIIDEQTAPWGIKVSVVEVKDVEIPSGMQRAMARQAEAERERRAKVIAAEGEFQAAERLKDAALVIEEHPGRAPAPLPADADRGELGRRLLDDRVSAAARVLQRVHVEERRRLSGELRRDPISGREVVIAPARAGRPGAGRAAVEPPSADELERCPFCEGREDRTPPETFAVAPEGRKPDTPGWSVRVVPNLYPALERQEVVVSVPWHARSLAELDDTEVARIAEAWRARAAAAGAEGFGYVQALLNEGREAGASLPHSHTQLAWIREVPPAVAAERTRPGDCGVCELIAGGENVIAERDGIVVHGASRRPAPVRAPDRARGSTSPTASATGSRSRSRSSRTRSGASTRPWAARCRSTRGSTPAATGTSSSCRA